MGLIQELPELVANKIAAGEVVERPASVVKELVENAIDAQATRIEIHLEQGGKKLIRVTDDGVGMDADDVGMCFHPHATSKLKTSQDLFFITTLGFRGEALPSVGAIAQVRLVSRQAGSPSAMAIEVAGGQFTETKPGAAPEGTTVEVRNLFFNTPARQKFLRTPKTELGHVMDMVTRIALPHEHIHFVVSHDGKTLVNAPAAAERRDRLGAFFGRELAHDLLLCEGGEGPLMVEGFIAPPHHSRASRSMQFIFLNRRYIRDRSISAAIREAYQGLLFPGRQPILFLFLQVDPREVDFNVHPTKVEVRFRQGRRVYGSVLGAMRAALSAADLAPPLRPTGTVPPAWDQVRRAASGAPPLRAGPAAPGLPFAEAPDHLEDARTQPRAAPTALPPDPFGPAPARPTFFQVHNAYIIEETPDGFRVTDQHALHERVLYEELRRRSDEAGVESQRLLMPEVVQLDAREAAVAGEILGQLKALGIEVEEFGENTLAVQAVPRLLGDVDCGELLHDLLGELAAEEGDTLERRRQQLLSALACKAAVQFGQRLGQSEIQALLTRRDALGIEAETCPHGRPASLLFSLDHMERQFKRK